MSGFRPMLVIADVSPRAPLVDHSAPLGRLGHWVVLMRQVPAIRVSEQLDAAGFVRSDWSWESDLPN